MFQVKWIEQQVARKRVKRDIVFNDPKWPIMWYLVSHLYIIHGVLFLVYQVAFTC